MSARIEGAEWQGVRDLVELNMLGDLHARAGDSGEASKYFERVGRAYREANFTEKAVAVYKKLARLDPDNVEAQFAVAELSLSLRRRSDARAYYDRAIALNRFAVTSKRALAILRGICALAPGDVEMWLELAGHAVVGGFPYEAHYAYAAAGRALLERGETERAYAAYESALANHPVSCEALSALSDRLMAEGRVDEAVDMVRDAAGRDPHDAALLELLGRTFRRAGRLDDAEAAFSRLLDVSPAHARCLLDVGSRFASAGDTDRALRVVDRALAGSPGAETRRQAVGLLRQIAAADPGRDDALERLADLCARDLDRAGEAAALSKLADRAAARGDEARAASLLRRLVGVAPDETHRSRLDALARDAAEPAPGAQADDDEIRIEIEVEEEPPRAAEARERAALSEVVVVRSLARCLEAEWRRAVRASAPLSVLRVRADAAAGDALEATLERPGDLLACCGDGEFIAVLPGTFHEGAGVVAKKMIVAAGPAAVRVGIASAVAGRRLRPEDLVAAAERALDAAGPGEAVVGEVRG